MARILALQALSPEPKLTQTPCFSVSWSGWSILTE